MLCSFIIIIIMYQFYWYCFTSELLVLNYICLSCCIYAFQHNLLPANSAKVLLACICLTNVCLFYICLLLFTSCISANIRCLLNFAVLYYNPSCYCLKLHTNFSWQSVEDGSPHVKLAVSFSVIICYNHVFLQLWSCLCIYSSWKLSCADAIINL